MVISHHIVTVDHSPKINYCGNKGRNFVYVYLENNVKFHMCRSDNKNRKVPDDLKKDYTNAPVVYYPSLASSPSKESLNIRICLEECPKVGGKYDPSIPSTVEVNGNTYNVYNTIEVLNRCIPDLSNQELANLGDISDKILSVENWFTRVVHDVAELWWLILACIGGAFVVGWFWLFFVRCFVGVISYFMIFLCFCCLLALSVYTWSISDNLNLDADNILYNFTDDNGLRRALKILRIVCVVITVVYFLMIVFLRKRIKLAIAVIKEASTALRKSPCLTIFPFFQFLFYAIFFVYWVVIVLFLASSYDEKEYTVDIQYKNFDYHPKVDIMYLAIYHLFGGLWMVYWIAGLTKVTIAGVVASRYWTDVQEDAKHLSVIGSLFRTLRYSAGSVALGSLLMATIKFLRIIFEYFKRAKAKALEKDIKWLKCVLKIVSCCIWCFEKVIRFITDSAYIMIAIAGKGFCKSAGHALVLQSKNFIRILVLKGISFFTLALTRLAISLICTLIATIVCYNYTKISEHLQKYMEVSTLHFWYVPVLIVLVGSFIMAGVFTNVYHTSIDTIMLSFCEDESMGGAPHHEKLGKLMEGKSAPESSSDGEHKSKSSKKSEKVEMKIMDN